MYHYFTLTAMVQLTDLQSSLRFLVLPIASLLCVWQGRVYQGPCIVCRKMDNRFEYMGRLG
jgi:hypothetical protein